jgi:hypothetical protein
LPGGQNIAVPKEGVVPRRGWTGRVDRVGPGCIMRGFPGLKPAVGAEAGSGRVDRLGGRANNGQPSQMRERR